MVVVVKIERRGVVGPCVTRSINNNMKWNSDDRLGYAYLSDCYTQSSNPDARHGVFYGFLPFLIPQSCESWGNVNHRLIRCSLIIGRTLPLRRLRVGRRPRGARPKHLIPIC